MKKQKKIKAKKLRNHAPNAAKAYWCYKYWDWFVSNNPVTRYRYDYYESEDGIFARVA